MKIAVISLLKFLWANHFLITVNPFNESAVSLSMHFSASDRLRILVCTAQVFSCWFSTKNKPARKLTKDFRNEMKWKNWMMKREGNSQHCTVYSLHKKPSGLNVEHLQARMCFLSFVSSDFRMKCLLLTQRFFSSYSIFFVIRLDAKKRSNRQWNSALPCLTILSYAPLIWDADRNRIKCAQLICIKQ